MYSAYGEFLSLARVDSAVDGLFKAYLDSTLVGFRLDDTCPYSDNVLEFRRQRLDPFTLKKNQTMLPDATRLSIQARLEKDEAGRTFYDQAADYLYWFDLRAAFWEKAEVDDQIKSLVTSPEALLKLRDAAIELQARRAWALDAERKKEKQPVTKARPTASSSILPIVVADSTKRASKPPSASAAAAPATVPPAPRIPHDPPSYAAQPDEFAQGVFPPSPETQDSPPNADDAGNDPENREY